MTSPPADSSDLRAVVLVPLKAFDVAKERLAPVLDPAERARLARSMADIVVDAAVPLPVVIVTDDAEVASWADRRGARLIWRPARGLDDAVQHSVASLATEGIERVVVAHGDLPRAHHLAAVAEFDGATLVPDRHDDGTNVCCVPATAGFRFAYGPGSFARHRTEAARLDLPTRIMRDAALGWDVDRPEDLEGLRQFLIAEY
ncbi:MAG: 2-phospho-L-lactate guanylyltransferase [Acidimicrobiia bacterium]|nr:2-phospho-L-lactate guanylyltransferase [Acidimicrobiia bacterium]